MAKQDRGVSGQLDRQLAQDAYKKLMAGQRPTRQEAAALGRQERKLEEERRWKYYESIPQKHWRTMSGRQAKVLAEQADRYGIPFGGREVRLPDVVKALHNFLAEHAQALAKPEAAEKSPAMEQFRRERARMARLERQQRENTLLPRQHVREGLERIAAVLRTAGEILERQFGRAAGEVIDEALDEAARQIDQLFAHHE